MWPLVDRVISLISSLASSDPFFTGMTSVSENCVQAVRRDFLNSFMSVFSGCDVADANIKAIHTMHDRTFNNVSLIDATNYSGLAVGFVAMVSHCIDIVVALHRFNSNAVLPSDRPILDIRCNTAVHLTLNYEVMRSLLEKGADVEAENIGG